MQKKIILLFLWLSMGGLSFYLSNEESEALCIVFNSTQTGCICDWIYNDTYCDNCDWVNCRNNDTLEFISLKQRKVELSIPPQIWLLSPYLITFEAHNVTGTIPTEIGLLTNLYNLVIEGNSLQGTIPSQIGNLTKLFKLQISNSQISGTIPSQISECDNLESLELTVNQLTGTIPWEIGCYLELDLLNLAKNKLTGTIPPQLAFLTTITHFLLNDNQFTGTVPMELSFTPDRFDLQRYNWCPKLNATDLPAKVLPAPDFYELRLSNNNLKGTIPPQFGFISVQLDLSNNMIEGTIPSQLFFNLSSLYLGGNKLSGSIPPQIGSSRVKFLNISYNSLVGTIPPQLGSTPNYFSLYGRSNSLTGTLPPQLSFNSYINYFDIRENSLYGTIPRQYCNTVFGLMYLGRGLSGCYPNCTGLSRFNKFSCELKGSTFGCDDGCRAPDVCFPNSCSAIYNILPVSSPPSPPSAPSKSSPPSVHSPSSITIIVSNQIIDLTPIVKYLISLNSTTIVNNQVEVQGTLQIKEGSTLILNLNSTLLSNTELISEYSLIILGNGSTIIVAKILLSNTIVDASKLSTIKSLGTGSIVNSQIIAQSYFTIDGQISFENTTFVLFQDSHIVILGSCANFSTSTAVLHISDFSKPIMVISSDQNCTVPFKSISVDDNGCYAYEAKQSVVGNDIMINFLPPKNKCSSMATIDDSVSVALICGSIGGAILIIISILLILVKAVPKVHQIFFPYSQREYYSRNNFNAPT